MGDFTVKLIPSDEGANAFVKKGHHLGRISLAGGTDAIGLTLPRYDHDSIQRLAYRGYLSRVEAQSADFLHYRSEVQELSNVLGVSALRIAFGRDMAREVNRLSAPLRSKPRSSEKSGSPVATMRSLLTGMKQEKRSAVEAVASMLKGLDLRVLKAVDRLARMDSTGTVLSSFREILIRYGMRMEIPEYFALVVLELVNNLQVQTMQSFARKSGMKAEKIRQLYQDQQVREQIRQLIERQGESSAITWNLVPHEGSGTRTTELNVTMTGSGTAMRALGSEVKEKSGLQVGERSLEEFYNELGESVFNIDLGLYYLSYLEDLCRKAGMAFSTRVRDLTGTDDRIVMLRLDI